MEEIKLNTNKIETEKTGYSQKLIEVLKTGDADKVLEVLTQIDLLLVPHDNPNQSQMYLNRPEVEKFLKDVAEDKYFAAEVIYLCDGGISRLVLQYKESNFNFEMSPVSSSQTKANWEKIK